MASPEPGAEVEYYVDGERAVLSGGPGAGSGVGGSDWTDCYWSRLRWCSEYRKLWRSCCVCPSRETRGGC